MSVFDYEKLRATPLRTEPFSYVIVPQFIRDEALAGINADYPAIGHPGSFPLHTLKYGPRFAGAMEELESPALRNIVAEKFAIDLSQRPPMTTVRGRARKADGRVHTDSDSKVMTLLLYMNNAWEAPGGRLRLLRSPDLADAFDEVAPDTGTLLVFRNVPNAWHGHEPFEGERRVIQLNYVTSDAVVAHERRRHSLSSFMKRLFGKRAGGY
ncbi:MAG: 2OG-Fe(II) oxygenase [Alphaproteobacteria bacterium]